MFKGVTTGKQGAMYCVCCGILLDGENQAGIVCQPWKENQHQQDKRGTDRKQPIQVSHCSRCGEPYHPLDASIAHRSCQSIGPVSNDHLSM